MVMTQAAVFGLMDQRVAWLAQRQRTRAQTVVGAERPGSRPPGPVPFAAARATAGNAVAIGGEVRQVGDIEQRPERGTRRDAKSMSLFRLAFGRNP